MDPDVVFDEVCAVIGKASSVPCSREDQKVFSEGVVALSAWLAHRGPPPAHAGRDIYEWLSGAKAALYVLQGYSQ